MLRDYKGAESVDTTDPNTEVARQFAQQSSKRVGRVLSGKYELLKTIGVGGMGAVFEARHQLTGRRVAVKLIHHALAGNRGHVARFMREAKAASEIGHPAIVDVLDAGTTEDGLVYMVLELLTGEDLEDASRLGKLTTREVVAIAIDVLDCLAAAHDRGVVHRDVKPENVFLAVDEDGRRQTKVLDFGIAKHLRDDPDTAMTRTGTIVGTPDFMSPEQARGDAVDGRTDLWAVGALLYYALAREPPFVADNYNKLIIRIVTEDAPSISLRRQDLPAELVDVIDRAMRRKPEERWADARSMLEALRAIPPEAFDEARVAAAGQPPLSRSGVRPMPGNGSDVTSVAPLSAPITLGAVLRGRARRSLVVVGALVLVLAALLLANELRRRAGTSPLLDGTVEVRPDTSAGPESAAANPPPEPPAGLPPPDPGEVGAATGVTPPEVPAQAPRVGRPGGHTRPPVVKTPEPPVKRVPHKRHGFATEYE